ncbi:MAG: class I SAM-dependent methyltransferase [Acidobacteria bacterium]|jgi:O-antigen chain-terminating methyltransferase|nr:class I SAM-dependent methyltransferase [Acidobacteriota bacterium]
MNKADSSTNNNMSSLWPKLKASWRGLKKIRRLPELDDLKQQNCLLKLEIDRLHVSLEEMKRKTAEKWEISFDGPGAGTFDDFYYDFEEKFRGSRDLVKSRLLVYLPYVKQTGGLNSMHGFLDIGCGRGEWLELLKENNVPARGIDLNMRMVSETRNRGLEVEHADVLIYLRKLPAHSLSGISGFHVIEHLPFAVLMAVLAEAYRVLVPDGVLILETPNPENFIVGSCNFYVDPTHRHPVMPIALGFMLNQSGFKEYESLQVSLPEYLGGNEGVPASGVLKALVDHMTVGQDYGMITFKTN